MTQQFTPEEVAALKKVAADSSKPRTTHVLQVLDRSSSMAVGKAITISAYNEQLEAMRQAHEKDGSEITVTLVMFANTAEIAFKQRSITDFQGLGLDDKSYQPDGMTALYDAIGLAIETAQTFPKDGDTAFLLQIFTDGDENSSRNYGAAQLKSKIEELNATGKWTVTVAGPHGSVDLFARSLSIYAGNVTGFNPSSLQSRTYNKTAMINAHTHYFAERAAGVMAVADAYSSTAGHEGDGLVIKDVSTLKVDAQAATPTDQHSGA